MAETIKGITIEIGANTTGLQKALSDVTKKSKDIQSELKQVEKLLKLDPTNTTLLAQKQELLAKAIGNAKEKLDTLRNAQEQVNAQFAKGEISEGQYRAFQREVAKAEQELSKFESQLKDTGSTAKKIGPDFDKLGANLKGMGEKLKGIGATMSAAFTAPIVGGFLAVTQGTKELRQDLGKLEAQFISTGHGAEVGQEMFTGFYGILGEDDTAIEAVNHLAELTKNQEELTEWTTIATGVYAKFGDSLPIEGLTEAANETAKVGQVTGPLADALNWVGISEDKFNQSLATYNTEAERATFITDTLSKAYSSTAEEYRKANADLIAANEAQAQMNLAMAELGNTLQPLLTPIITTITELVNKFNEMDPAGQKVIVVIAGIVAAIGPLLVVVGTLSMAIAAISAPVAIAIAAFGALVAAGVLLWKNWEEIQKKANQIWDSIKNYLSTTWNNIITFGTTAWEGFKKGLLGIWEGIVTGIKGYANGIIRLVNGIINALNTIQVDIPDWVPDVGGETFGINIPNVPYLAAGGIVTRPTLAMIGESGPEAVVPLTQMQPTIGTINIYGSNPTEIWHKFERELNRRGVRL